jgi:1-hydroxycarotenoid 3,4-desaturase
MNSQRVVVVGAGVGGLVAALLLARRGLSVTLVEVSSAPGGKMRRVMVEGADVDVGPAGIDAGPTVFTMRWIFDAIFAEVGETLESHLRITPLSVLARHAWEGDARLDLHADARASADAIGGFAGPAEARRFTRFCDQARQVYNALEGPYIHSSRPTLLGMMGGLGPRGLAALAGLGPFASLWRALARHFHDPRLQQLFGRYATYCGSSPFAAPATLMLVAQVEMDGVWSVDGGMAAVAAALADIARRNGVSIRYDTACAEILVRDGRASGIRLADGEQIAADAVVFNGDVAALAGGLAGAAVSTAVPPVPRAERSLSALTWAINARTSGFPLVRHNVFFATDYASEFRDIFTHGRLPRAGTVYVCAQDRDDAKHHDGAPERLLCLVNAPANGDAGPDDSEEILTCEKASFSLLQRAGLTIERSIRNTVATGPRQFGRLYPATGGALYGQASHGWMASFRRPGAASRLPGLYLAGGSVHPGPGVPMAAMSGRLAAATLMAHLDSTSRSKTVVISGGISTRSATTAGTG